MHDQSPIATQCCLGHHHYHQDFSMCVLCVGWRCGIIVHMVADTIQTRVEMFNHRDNMWSTTSETTFMYHKSHTLSCVFIIILHDHICMSLCSCHCSCGHINIVEYLLTYCKCDVNSKSHYEYTPLHYAAE